MVNGRSPREVKSRSPYVSSPKDSIIQHFWFSFDQSEQAYYTDCGLAHRASVSRSSRLPIPNLDLEEIQGPPSGSLNILQIDFSGAEHGTFVLSLSSGRHGEQPKQGYSKMTISIACPCGKRLRAKDQAAGRKTRCPACGNDLIIPSLTGSGDVLDIALRLDKNDDPYSMFQGASLMGVADIKPKIKKPKIKLSTRRGFWGPKPAGHGKLGSSDDTEQDRDNPASVRVSKNSKPARSFWPSEPDQDPWFYKILNVYASISLWIGGIVFVVFLALTILSLVLNIFQGIFSLQAPSGSHSGPTAWEFLASLAGLILLLAISLFGLLTFLLPSMLILLAVDSGRNLRAIRSLQAGSNEA
jgi:hypothetical protein